ncbi:MAG: tryptophan synthase subunit alpha [Chloroflexota bacterium]
MSPATATPPATERVVSSAPATAGAQRIAAAFARAAGEGRAALIPYAVAGYPDADRSFAVALALIDNGADLVEIGLPYSDPLADGATLQRASRIALDHGATLDRSVALVARIRAARPDVPLVAMGYVNQVIGGKDGASVLERLGAAGVSGMILADLPPDEGAELEAAAAAHGMSIIYLVTPTTTEARLRMIAGRSGGFLYAVSLAGVTGARTSLPPGVTRFLAHVRAISPVPVAVGFGVSKAQHARTLAPYADGVIVASALVDSLGPDGDRLETMAALVRELRSGTGR